MDNKFVLIVIALLLAPLAVFLKKGAGKDLIINVVFCFMCQQSSMRYGL